MTLFTTNKMLNQVQDDEVSDSNGNEIPDNADSQDSQVRLFASISGMTATATVLAVLTICIFTITPALSAFQCVECPENFFCKNGQKTACPASTPVTNGTQKSLQSDCMTCYQKTGNSATAGFKDGICTDCYTADPTKPAWNGSSCTTCLAAEGATKPVYSDLAGRCVSCGEKDSSTPNWNGTTCVGCSADTPYFNPSTLACEACPSNKPNWDGTQCVTCEDGYYEEEITCADGTEWNETSGKCESTTPKIEVNTTNCNYYVSIGMIFKASPVNKATCQEMLNNPSKYPEINGCTLDSDAWAGAVKHCRDQGQRLPTRDELACLAQKLYNDETIDKFTHCHVSTYTELSDATWAALSPDPNETYVTFLAGEASDGPPYIDAFQRTFQKNGGTDGIAIYREDPYYAFCVPQ